MRSNACSAQNNAGFTLVELAVVLTVIGLLVAAVLVGTEMIRAAEVRNGIAQIEKYNTATNVFRNKCHFLPGDVIASATNNIFGFDQRDPTMSVGDGDRMIEAYNEENRGCGEDMLYWRDLARAKLIESDFLSYTYNDAVCGPDMNTLATLSLLFPVSKLAQNAFILIYVESGRHYYEITGVDQTNTGYSDIVGVNGFISPSLSASLAYEVDSKIDDGFALSGTVQATNASGSKVNNLATAQAPAANVCVTNTLSPGNYHMVDNDTSNVCGIRIQAEF